MKKLICCLVMLLSFSIVAPVCFGSFCEDQCWNEAEEFHWYCSAYYMRYCDGDPICVANMMAYCDDMTELLYQNCIAECQ